MAVLERGRLVNFTTHQQGVKLAAAVTVTTAAIVIGGAVQMPPTLATVGDLSEDTPELAYRNAVMRVFADDWGSASDAGYNDLMKDDRVP